MTVNSINVTNLDPETWKAFKHQLALDGLTVSQWTRAMIEQYLEASKPPITR